MEMITTVFLLCGLLLALGWLLQSAQARLKADDNELIAAIDALLPQSQCAQCGYPGCRPYAEAVAGGAALDLCPPGGIATFKALQQLLGRDDGATPPDPQPLLARIREPDCIGCFLCIPACPVDAIIGAPGFMHTVIEDECTGCELCVPACPVDCIEFVRTGANSTSSARDQREIVRAINDADEFQCKSDPTTSRPSQSVAIVSAKRPSAKTSPLDRNVHEIPAAADASGKPGSAWSKTLEVLSSTPTTPKSPRDPARRHRDGPRTSTTSALPCIGCNRCEPACPVGLAPRELLWLTAAEKWRDAASLGLERCIECSLCDRACPSGIPLAATFGIGKSVLAESVVKRTRATHAKTRHEARVNRLAAEQDAAQARRAARLARRVKTADSEEAAT